MSNPFHFPSLVWDEIIAIYLFLLGISAGATLLAVLFKRTLSPEAVKQSKLIQMTAFISPLTLLIGLIILIFHLTKPWTFWYLMFNYHSTSIMSMGVMLFQIYMLVLFTWLAVLFREWVAKIITRFIPKMLWIMRILEYIARWERYIDIILIILAALLGAYTGFLLSALISYPMLNNPVLPVLFLASGTSSGIATLMIAILMRDKVSALTKEIHFLHKIEIPVVCIEIFLLFAFFIGLYLGGGQKTVAFHTALGGCGGR